MTIGITDEHVELATTMEKWAASLVGCEAARAAEGDPGARFDTAWSSVREMGLTSIALPGPDGGGGTVLDLAVALEAAARQLVPGRLLGGAAGSVLGRTHPEVAEVLAAGRPLGLGAVPDLSVTAAGLAGRVPVVLDGPGAEVLLLGATDATGRDRWFLVGAEEALVSPHASVDLTRRTAEVAVDIRADRATEVVGLDGRRVRDALVTVAAAEASGVARWCLATAVEHAGVREQFGARIGSFQAVKHLCAQMLEHAEAITAVAWDAASAAERDPAQWHFAAEVAGTVALDGAVRVAQDCIQVLGGIGFTFEHDAHLYLRRATALRSLLGSGATHAAEVADLAVAGRRRRLEVDLEGRDDTLRPGVRDRVTSIAALPPDRQRVALVDAGYLAPHWPEPYGRGAGPVEQLVIDEELAVAGVVRPDLGIGGWAVPTILAHGTPGQQERFVRPTLLGEVVWCQLFSEPGAGSDLASLRTRADRVDPEEGRPGGWRLTGQKVWTSLAREADWAICLARTDPEAPRHRGITYFLVDMRAEGITVRPLREMTGDELFNEVFLDGVFVPDACVVGEVGGGWPLARTTLANERVAMAGSRLGGSTEEAVGLLQEVPAEDATRVAVGHQVALATVGSLLGVRTTLRSLAGKGPGAESSVAKLLGVRNRQEASELVVEMLGDRVFTGDERARAAVHEMLLTRCLSIAGGTTQILRNVAAERVLGLPR